ncbi:PDDEXK nuclease domain-containing protein [Desulfovibrio cuneatus]|uniref:PDDEXK nuclease domain-containing protein n=1 Tax=Desulfovibrio cuneatus TaxID=159728 RepID=UPI0004088E18|nr:PDDEXK nuclease domain-containing protein [Desulfovibrio cuneatus]
MSDNSSKVSVLKVRGSVPADYAATLADLKERIHAGRMRAALAVNREVIDLYWSIGKTITKRQHDEGWGKSTVERLAADLSDAFPEMKGFSPTNIWRMRSFYLAWPSLLPTEPILAQPVPELPEDDKPATNTASTPEQAKYLAQVVRELPWGHNVTLVQKVKTPEKRLWYAQMARKHGWARSILSMQIETDLHERQGQAVSNFMNTLPAIDSDLASHTMKDPYNFDFLGLAKESHERDIENALLAHIKRFLLELGEGFAFVGQQYKVSINESDFYIDLLFYHINLRCYVVVELKAVSFQPEFAGKLNFYLSVVDDTLRREGDKPTIGLILCKDKDRLVAEYALKDINKPIAVADYLLTKAIPEDLKGALPTIEEIEDELMRGE